MHAIGLARKNYGPGDLEVCRNRLIQQLAGRLTEEASFRTTVVFDAFAASDNSSRHQVQHGLKVTYAPAGTDADSEIERHIADHNAPRQLLVVSSDHRLHQAARRRKAKSIDSDLFWNSLEPDSSPPASARRQTGQQSTAFWLKEFSDVAENLQTRESDDVFDSDYLSDLESELDG